MNEALALQKLREVIALIDEYGDVYKVRWEGVTVGRAREDLHPRLMELTDQVRRQARMAQQIGIGMGERDVAARIVEHEEGLYAGHPWQQARKAIIVLEAILDQREELAVILGPVGPQLSVTAMHPTIWNAAAGLWDNGHPRQAVQTAGQALEGMLQIHAGAGLSGERLAALFSTTDPATGSPRLRIRGLDPQTETWKSAHDGAAGLVRAAMMAVRNLVSHPGWPDPTEDEALEMLAVLSYVARFADRCDVVTA